MKAELIDQNIVLSNDQNGVTLYNVPASETNYDVLEDEKFTAYQNGNELGQYFYGKTTGWINNAGNPIPDIIEWLKNPINEVIEPPPPTGELNLDVDLLPGTLIGVAGSNGWSSSTNSWFKPYLASEFPELTGITKTYFFLWSTDHQSGANAPGGIFWGEADNLDCSDFVDRGLIMDGHQMETPWLYRTDDPNNPISLHVHCMPSHPQITDVIQQTLQFTTTGGDISDPATWGAPTVPFTRKIPSDTHLGYSEPYKRENDFIALHHTDGQQQEFGASVSLDGVNNWTRLYDAHERYGFFPDPTKPTWGHVSNVFTDGVNDYAFSPGGGEGKMNIMRLGADYEWVEFMGSFATHPDWRDYACYQDGNTLHIYWIAHDKRSLYHTQWEITR